MSKVTPLVLVVGGGPAGMEAALKIGEAGHGVVLVEKESVLGGNLLRLHRSFPRYEDPSELATAKVARLLNMPEVEIVTGAVVGAVERTESGFAVKLVVSDGEVRALDTAAVVLATGFDMFDARCYGEYGYEIFPGVTTGLEFEDQLREWSSGNFATPAPKSVAFFMCVGSRDRVKGHPYCSKICCMYSAKQARVVKDLFPDAKCFVLYMDYRAAGKGYEEFVRSVIEEDRVRYIRGRPSKVLPLGERLVVRAEDTLMGVPVEIEADIVVLATAIVPRPGTLELAHLFGARTDEYGFLESDTADPAKCGDRVFAAGAATFAVGIGEAQAQGAAAAAGVISLLRQANQEEG